MDSRFIGNDAEHQVAFHQMIVFLETRMEDFKNEEKRLELSDMDLSIACQILEAHISQLSMYPPSPTSGESLQLILHTLRCMRNACVSCSHNQHKIVTSSPGLATQTVNCLLTLNQLMKIQTDNCVLSRRLPPPELLQCLLVGTQFLGNLYTGNEEGVDLLWQCEDARCVSGEQMLDLARDLCSIEARERSCELQVTVDKLRYAASMLLYNLLKSPLTMENILSEGASDSMKDCISLLLQLYLIQHNEWGFLLAGHLYTKASYLYKCFHCLPVDVRCCLLEIMCDHLPPNDSESDETSAHILPSRQCIDVIVDYLLDTCHTYTNMTDKFQHSLLSSLCMLSSRADHCLLTLQDNKELLISLTDLLHIVHKSDESTSVPQSSLNERLDQMSLTTDTDGAAAEPVGVKQLLVRLIANLVFRNTHNQNMVREREVIPVILECCQLSDADPFLREWCVYAIRNLCEDNVENQQYISTIQPVTSSKLVLN